MQDLTLNDDTQNHLLSHLKVTEKLLAQVSSDLSGSERTARVVAMPDLGFPHNIQRIHGGFFTGALYAWDTAVPFVPIDATINCCGVSVFRLRGPIENKEHFTSLVNSAIVRNVADNHFVWNFANGHHFVTYGEVRNASSMADGFYAVLHSSAAEFKNQLDGLYPVKGNWYWDAVKVLRGPGHRFLRYIAGRTADKFIEKAHALVGHNSERHRHFASSIFGERNLEEEVLNLPHYGMPTRNSVAIGCQWNAEKCLLLTAPDKPLLFLDPQFGCKNHLIQDDTDLLLTPHGLGVRSKRAFTLRYDAGGIWVNDNFYSSIASLSYSPEFEIRCTRDDANLTEILDQILQKCPARVMGSLQPVYSYCRTLMINQSQ